MLHLLKRQDQILQLVPTHPVSYTHLDVYKRQVIGWTYQFYQAKTKREVYDYLSKKGKIDSHSKLIAVTQCYTEKYIVKYLLENTLGRLWLEMHPHSQLRQKMSFFDNNPELVTRSVKSVEDLTIIDPAGGSGHFLLYAFDLLYEMYIEEQGFSDSIPAKIIKNNLFGLDIDPRSIQLMALSLYIKAKSKSKNVDLKGSNLYSLKVTNFENKDIMKLTGFLNLKNSVENDFFNSILHTKHLDLIGSLFRLKNGKNSTKNNINFFNTIHSYETNKTQFIDKFIKAIEDHFPAERDAPVSYTHLENPDNFTYQSVGKKDLLFTLPQENSNVEDTATKLLKLEKTLSEYRTRKNNNEVREVLDQYSSLVKDYQNQLNQALKEAYGNGQLIYQSEIIPIKGNLWDRIKKLMDETIIPGIYTEIVDEKPSIKEIQMIFTENAKKLCKTIENKDYQVFDSNGDLQEGHRLISPVILFCQNGKLGSELFDYFSEAPYAWPQETILYICAALIRAGKLEINNLDDFTSPVVAKILTTPAQFKSARLQISRIIPPDRKVKLIDLFEKFPGSEKLDFNSPPRKF